MAEQVAGTASWALAPGGAVSTVAVAPVQAAERLESVWRDDPTHIEVLRLLLAAHYLTVGTFCPTDVDTRIRHHYWAEVAPERLAEAVSVIDEFAALDPRPVSARALGGEHGPLSGHDGEWFSVRAGALGRALADGRDDLAEHLTSRIEAELEREQSIFEARTRANDLVGALSAATILAHNTGDLSRVVEAWPAHERTTAARERFSKLGHTPDRTRWGGAFYVAGVVNKKVMALENHRFLALRKPRALRTSRDLLLPIGPFFEPWGAAVARTLGEEDRADVVAALLETHLRGPDQVGAIRALRGIAESSSGPWKRVVERLPARLRKVLTAGDVPNAMKTTDAVFVARLEKRYRVAMEEARA